MKKVVYLPSWLGGWAIALGILGQTPTNNWLHMGVAVAVSMIVGVVYVGVGVLKFQTFMSKIFISNGNN
ncbi:MAG: rane protein [Firmicutes bacterium]|nr:rane protein [Bacillota bacterium]